MGYVFAALLLLGCEEQKQQAPQQKTEAQQQEEEPEPPPSPPNPPTLTIDDLGPKVRFSRTLLTDDKGIIRAQGLEQLRSDLKDEQEFIAGKELVVTVDRKAKLEWVSVYLQELAALDPKRIDVATETREEYPKQVHFVSEKVAEDAPPCTLVGTITEDRGTAIWRLQGGTARKRGRGMGGPDLTMTGETITRMAKSCESELFVVTAAEGVEWGLIYDLTASAMNLEDAGLGMAFVPTKRPTPGHPVEIGE